MWARLSPPTPPATALAAAEAAAMPLRRPRRPAAVSVADADGAGPELGCAGQLERAAEAPIDEASSLWVGSVSRSVGRSVRSGRRLEFDIPGAYCLRGGSIPPRRVLSNHGQDFLASRLFFASLGRSAAVLMDLMYPGLLAFAGVRPPPARCLSVLATGCGWVVLPLWNRRVLVCSRAREPPPFAVRRALFSAGGGVGRFS